MPQSIVSSLIKARILGKSPVDAYLRLNERSWKHLPQSFTVSGLFCSYGNLLHKLVRLRATRAQSFGTFFLRNRPQLQVMRGLVEELVTGSSVKMCVLACSKGAEVYSILWAIRSARPDLRIEMQAVDISKEVLEFAQRGVYSLTAQELVDIPVFGRMTDDERGKMFEEQGGKARIRPEYRDGVTWRVGDAGDPGILETVGAQDIVVANNFLCHMEPGKAESCLRNVARSVRQGGYLFVSGIDLDVRTKVARELGWKPVPDLLEEIHEADWYLREGWPWKYWGLEPLNKSRRDWRVRYATVFRLGNNA